MNATPFNTPRDARTPPYHLLRMHAQDFAVCAEIEVVHLAALVAARALQRESERLAAAYAALKEKKP